MPKRYHVHLPNDERQRLEQMVHAGKHVARVAYESARDPGHHLWQVSRYIGVPIAEANGDGRAIVSGRSLEIERQRVRVRTVRIHDGLRDIRKASIELLETHRQEPPR